MSTIARQAIAAIVTRLEAIAVASGFNTDAGDEVHLGVRSFDATSQAFPAVSVFSGGERVERLTAGRYRNTREILIAGYVNDTSTPTVALEQLVEDVQQAMELADETLGGLVHSLEYRGIDTLEPRDDGGTVSTAVIRYAVEYDRNYGA